MCSRIERADPPLRLSRLNPVDALNARAGNRFDVAHVRGPNRLLTRAIAGWVYSRTDEHGGALYAGIRYVSRLGDFECCAVFDGAHVELDSTHYITLDDTALQEVASLYHLSFR